MRHFLHCNQSYILIACIIVLLNMPASVVPAQTQQSTLTLLYITTAPGSSAFLRKAIAGTEINIEVVSPKKVPSAADGLKRYDGIFLSNVPARSLSAVQMTALQTACHDFGVGIGIIGGESSYAAGGYRGTPLEVMLPIDLDIKTQNHLPDVAVALIMEDIEVPNRENDLADFAITAMGLLESGDQFGVLDGNGPSTTQAKRSLTRGIGASGCKKLPIERPCARNYGK